MEKNQVYVNHSLVKHPGWLVVETNSIPMAKRACNIAARLGVKDLNLETREGGIIQQYAHVKKKP